jgi:superfamily II DNA or RNA helicase
LRELIVVEKVNEAYVKLICSDSIAGDISDYFTFFAPNYQFSPMFKKRVWDGKIRLYNKKTSYLYFGLLKYLATFAEERNIKLVVKDLDSFVNEFDIKEAKEYADTLQLCSGGKRIEPRDYQLKAFSKAIRNKKILLLSPTASGKSLIIYLITRYLIDSECNRGLLIVPTVSLVEQMYGDFKDYSTLNDWNVEKNCQKIYSGHEKEIQKNMTISTWQSLYDLPKEFFSQFDFIIGDEAHTFKANSLAKIMTNLINTKYRIGTTGTIDDVNVHKLSLEGFFGPVSKIVTTKELIDKGQLAKFTIDCIVLKYPKYICEAVKSMQYQKEIDFIVTNEKRNEFITNLALNLNGNTLILFQYVDKHGKVLKEILNNKVEEGRKVFFISGEVDVKEREEVRRITENETNAIIVASYGTFSTGVSIRNLHNVIFASPSKSKIRNLQSIGRGLRLGDNKEEATLYDIVDDLRVDDEKINYAMLHYAERMKIYHSEKFKVLTHKIGLT